MQLSGRAQMEQERSGKAKLTDEEKAQAAADAAVRDAPALKRLEQSDEAKRMNQMVLSSQCMAIRSASSSSLRSAPPVVKAALTNRASRPCSNRSRHRTSYDTSICSGHVGREHGAGTGREKSYWRLLIHAYLSMWDLHQARKEHCKNGVCRAWHELNPCMQGSADAGEEGSQGPGSSVRPPG